MKFVALTLAAALAALPLGPAWSAAQGAAGAAAPAATAMADGEVRKVDKGQGKLTLRHGPIANLDMPPMTMVFRVADPALLDNVKQGDKVKFSAEDRNGAITVTAIEAAK